MNYVYNRFLNLGEDTPFRAELSREITASLSKAVNMNKLVRVQRTVIRNGKSVLTHMWVLPGKVEKGDVVLQNKATYEKWLKDNRKEDESSQKATDDKLANPMAKLKGKKKQNKPAKKAPAKKQPESESKPPEKKPSAKPPEIKTPPTDTGKEKQKGNPNTAEILTPEFARKFNVPPEVFEGIYDKALLDKRDTLARETSFDEAVKALQGMSVSNSVKQNALEALAIQHYSEYLGKNEFKETAEWAGKQCPESKYSTEMMAASMEALRFYGSPVIAKTSYELASGINSENPTFTLYSDCITEMIRTSTTQPLNTPLYKGARLSQAAMHDLLQNNSVAMRGILETNDKYMSAAAVASGQTPGFENVIFEIPESLQTKVLPVRDSYSAKLIEGAGNYSIESISKDWAGRYIVRLTSDKVPANKPIAAPDIYEKFGVPLPGAEPKQKPEPTDFEAVIKAATSAKGPHFDRYDMMQALPYALENYGYEGVKTFAESFAKAHYKDDDWNEVFQNTKSGYASEWLCLARIDWINTGYRAIRDMENKSLTVFANGHDIYNKLCNDALNAAVENDGVVQPGALYRGVHGGAGVEKYRHAQIGDILELGGISSFSLDRGIAEEFAYGVNDGPGIVLAIKKDAGIKSLYVEGLDEEEYMVQDQKFEVVGRDIVNGRVVLTLAPEL